MCTYFTADKLGVIHELIEQDSPERPNYVASALKWSLGEKNSEHRSGHPELHRKFAVTCWHGKLKDITLKLV